VYDSPDTRQTWKKGAATAPASPAFVFGKKRKKERRGRKGTRGGAGRSKGEKEEGRATTRREVPFLGGRRKKGTESFSKNFSRATKRKKGKIARGKSSRITSEKRKRKGEERAHAVSENCLPKIPHPEGVPAWRRKKEKKKSGRGASLSRGGKREKKKREERETESIDGLSRRHCGIFSPSRNRGEKKRGGAGGNFGGGKGKIAFPNFVFSSCERRKVLCSDSSNAKKKDIKGIIRMFSRKKKKKKRGRAVPLTLAF